MLRQTGAEIIIAIVGMFTGGSIILLWCQKLWWFPRWKAGFDQGYELGKIHGFQNGVENRLRREFEAEFNALIEQAKNEPTKWN